MTTKTPKAKPVKAVKLIEGKAAIIQAGASIARRTRRIDADVQQWAVSAVNHVNLHGDVRPINEFFTTSKVGSGLRADALKEYIGEFAKVAYNKKSKVFVHDKTAEGSVEDAQATRWTDFAVPKEYNPMNDIKMIKSLIKKLGTADAGKGDVVSDVTASKLDAVVVELEAAE